jgi:hypothetical protein
LLAIMFTLREKRRRKPALITYSSQALPNWSSPPDNRGPDPS